MTRTRIRQARPLDLDDVTDTLATAFLGGDLAGWLIPDRNTRQTVYADYFRMWAEHFLQHGQVDATDDADAVALWWPAGNHLDLDIPDYETRLSKITGEAYGRFVALDMAMHMHHPHGQPHHYLAFVAVQPDRQWQGLGSALLRHRLERLDAEGTPAYLEATGPRSKALYHRHGFRLLYPVDIPGGPELLPMWRPPSGAG
ncbi:GNAT family N-acetyltransferase [Dactylosporangium sp. CA-092794]|uniref:GNAT family N-acetyltransferase n=1 Tax=Dactylosporangium sp. CA-092794 TaxID=3239929 RepID=UPI003D8F9AC6